MNSLDLKAEHSTFLSAAEVKQLTGRTLKAMQCAQLRKQGVPFFENAEGRPIVARAAVEGRKVESALKGWRSAAVG